MDELTTWVEHALESSGDLFSRVLETSSNAIAITRVDDQAFLYVNAAFERVTGFARDDVLNHSPSELGMWNDETAEAEMDDEMSSGGRVDGFVTKFMARDGTPRWMEVSLQAITLGEKECVLSVSRDLTEYRSADRRLKRRDAILSSVAFAAERFLESDGWEEPIEDVLQRLGEAAEVSRVILYRNWEKDGVLVDWAQFEYTAPGVKTVRRASAEEADPYGKDFARWERALGSGEVVQGIVRDLPEAERLFLETEDTKAIVGVPVFVGDEWWGYLEFDDCEVERTWSSGEVEALRAAAGTLGAALRRTRAEEALVEMEDTHRTMIEQIPAVIYMESRNSPTADLYISPQYESIYGIPLEERLANPEIWRTLVHPDDLAAVDEEAERTNASGEPYRAEYRIKDQQGGWRWIRDEARLITDESGKSLHWFGVVVDITDRRQTENDLLAAETRYRALVERVPAITYQEEIPKGDYEAGSMIYLSPQAEKILGWKLGDFEDNADMFWEAIVHPDDREAVYAESKATVIAEKPYRQEYRVRTRDGEVLWFHDESVLVNQDDLGMQTWHGVMFDISEQRRVEDELRAAETRYRQLVERIPAVVYIDQEDPETEVGWRVTYMSPQIEEMTGFIAEEWIGTDLWQQQLHPDDRESAIQYDERTVKTGAPYMSEYRLFTKDGQTIWIREEASVILEADDTRHWQGVLTDITEQKVAGQELQRRDAILQAVADVAEQFLHTGVWRDSVDDVLERLGAATDASRVYVFENRIETGLLHTSMTNEWVADNIDPQIANPQLTDLPLALRHSRWIDALSAGGVITGAVASFPPEERLVLEPQQIKSLLLVPVFVDDDWWGIMGFDDCLREREWSHTEIEALRTAAGILGTAIRREQSERQLRAAEDRYRTLVERTPSVVYMDAVDDLSTALYISPQIKDLIGYTPEERVAQPDLWVERLHPDDVDKVVAENKRTNATGDPFLMDYRMVHRDGHTVWVRDECVLVTDDNAQPAYWLGVLIDITDRKRAEEELAHALDMERQAADQLRALDEMKNTFLTAVSHDLRTPLAAVLGLALTLEREDMDLDVAETRDLAKRIAANARKLDRMVVDLLDLDRLSRGVLELKLNRTDVGFLVRKVVDEAEFMGDHPVSVEADPVVSTVDLAKVERIVENLLANAARHTPPGTQVWVKVQTFEDGALIAVEDAGPGVLAELKEAIFEPFRQGDDAGISHSPGVGIGLSLVARFASLHGGRAWVEDRDGGGASFRVYLPDLEGTRRSNEGSRDATVQTSLE